jgi:hypothetical protein
VPVVLVPLVGFAFLITFVVLYGMERGNNQWLVPLVNALKHPQGSFLKQTALKIAGAALAAVSFIVRYTTHYLSIAASHSIGAVAHWIHGLASWIEHVGAAAGDFAVSVEHAIGRIVHNEIPAAIHHATVPIWRGIDHLEHDAARLAARLKAFQVGIDRIISRRILPAIRAAEHAIAVTIPHELGRIRAKERALERDITHPSRAWVKRIWRAGWILVGAGLMLKFLTRKFPWLFCRNTTAAAKAVCGMDSLLLDALLLETVALTGAISVVNFAKALQAVEGEAVHVMSLGIKELGDLEG